MKKKLLIIGICLLIIGEGIFLFIPFKKLNDDVEKVTYTENEIKNNKMFAYLMYNNEKSSYEEITDRTNWPDIETHAYVKAECYDGDGVKQKTVDVFNFNEDTFTATMTTNTTLYCYLYFAKTEDALGLIIKNSGGEGGTLESYEALQARNEELTAEGVATEDLDTLRRFVGNLPGVTDNFICFGTDNQDDCLANLDLYMYRIMGIDETNNQIKVIKATKIVTNTGLFGSTDSGTDFIWHRYDPNGQKITWPESDMYKYLNSTNSEESYFVANPNYKYMQNNNWTSLIVEHPKWYYGVDNQTTTDPVPKVTYKRERSSKLENDNSVGLMYLSDYLYAGVQNTTNWLHINRGLNLAPNTGTLTAGTLQQPKAQAEWLMTSTDTMTSGGLIKVWNIDGIGRVNTAVVSAGNGVRPVFYLKPGLKLTGKGTIETPYLIGNVTD